MSSEVEICNIALDFLGCDRIISLLDDTKPGKLCKLNYPIVRDAVLRAYPWSFAIRRASLAADATPPLYDWQYQYQLPVGPSPLYCLRVLDTEQDVRTCYKQWVIEGTRILTDYQAPLLIRYIAQITDTQTFDSLFVTALAAKLAVLLAANLTESAGRIDLAKQSYQDVITEARSTAAVVGQTGRMRGTMLLDSRQEWIIG